MTSFGANDYENSEREARSHNSRALLLAFALLLVELIGGVQGFVFDALLPTIGAVFDAHQFYGLILGSMSAAAFLTMPLGPWLLARIRIERMMVYLTWVNIVGAILRAIAPNVGVFIAGSVIAAMAGGALATVGMTAIITGLPAKLRRFVFAGHNAMWLIISAIGPLYATWITTRLNWRWAFVLYLPFLAFARFLIARQLRDSKQAPKNATLKLPSALALAAGVVMLSIVGFSQLPSTLIIALGLAGTALALFAGKNLLIPGTLTASPGRSAAVATLGLLTSSYFGVGAIMAIIAADLFGATPTQVALLLAISSFAWAVVGVPVSKWPATNAKAFLKRTRIGAIALLAGILLIIFTVTIGGTYAIPMLIAGWLIAGVGMGLIYLDTLNQIIEIPTEADNVSEAEAGASTIMVESIATAITGTLAAALLGRAVSHGVGIELGSGPLPMGTPAVSGGELLGGAGTAMAIAILGVLAGITILLLFTTRRIAIVPPSGASVDGAAPKLA